MSISRFLRFLILICLFLSLVLFAYFIHRKYAGASLAHSLRELGITSAANRERNESRLCDLEKMLLSVDFDRSPLPKFMRRNAPSMPARMPYRHDPTSVETNPKWLAGARRREQSLRKYLLKRRHIKRNDGEELPPSLSAWVPDAVAPGINVYRYPMVGVTRRPNGPRPLPSSLKPSLTTEEVVEDAPIVEVEAEVISAVVSVEVAEPQTVSVAEHPEIVQATEESAGTIEPDRGLLVPRPVLSPRLLETALEVLQEQCVDAHASYFSYSTSQGCPDVTIATLDLFVQPAQLVATNDTSDADALASWDTLESSDDSVYATDDSGNSDSDISLPLPAVFSSSSPKRKILTQASSSLKNLTAATAKTVAKAMSRNALNCVQNLVSRSPKKAPYGTSDDKENMV